MTAHTPNLPALIATLPGDHNRAPQTEFTRARQVLFIENLSVTGSARSASAAAGVSHQTAYRARRSCPQFRLAWDAALVAARRCAEDALASRAIDGVTEEVRYHGEVVGTRIRFSDRLLLAHLARLDRLGETRDAAAFAEDWDAAMARFGAGEEALAPQPEARPEPASPASENLSPGPCNTRSMSNTLEDEDCEDDDGIDWEDEAAAEAELARIEAAMAAERPAGAPRLDADDPHGAIADAQFQAFEAGVPRWWLVVPPAPYEDGEWCYADEEDAGGDTATEADSDNGDGAAPELDGADDDEPDEDGSGEDGPGEDNREDGDDPADADGTAPEAADQPGPHPAAQPVWRPEPRLLWPGGPIDHGGLQRFCGRGY